ncbi:MAG: hypothetical protein K9K63_06110 [Desulfotignum sp.]|nr:hypothetical protein [Desulfotignum sp.]MCF8136869.1 hypothetical protein [Desulfotignum sp.]
MVTEHWKNDDLKMSETDEKLLQGLKDAAPDTRLKVAVNLAKAGHWAVISCIPGLHDAVRAAMSQENNLSFDSTRAVAVPIGAMDME